MDRIRTVPSTHRKLTINITMTEASTRKGNEDDGGDDDNDDEFGLCTNVQFVQGFYTMKMDQVSGCVVQCSICLEDFSIRSEATRMTNLHLYHRDWYLSVAWKG